MVRIDILALEGSSALSFGVTTDVFSAANRLAGERRFDVRVLSTQAPTVALREGALLQSRELTQSRARDVVIVLGLGSATPGEIEARLLRPDVDKAAAWLRAAWKRGATVAASCTGVFLLARAGLLDGRRATSTWWLVPTLKAIAPSCDATLDAMLTEDDRVWTAGAAFAHIDLALGLLARFAGPALASDVARHLLVERRESQARFVAPVFLAAQDPMAHRVEGVVRKRLADAHKLEDLAADVGVSPRTLARRLAAVTGLSPMRFVQKIRVDAAIHRLQTTRRSIDSIAHEVGFQDASSLYRLMLRHTGQPPGRYRDPGLARSAQ